MLEYTAVDSEVFMYGIPMLADVRFLFVFLSWFTLRFFQSGDVYG